MLEIVVILVLFSRLGRVARARAISGWWAGLGPTLWLAGQVMGALTGGLLGFETYQSYGVSLTYGMIGALVSVVVVNNVPSSGSAQPP